MRCLILCVFQHNDYKKRALIVGTNRVLRGGSWNNNAENCRSANRNNNNPDNRNNNIGFRLVFVP
ncbi:MAG: SUMF1/EgtB/PvdO family nonheme iron enzyme [Saprospiraceae bacterium]